MRWTRIAATLVGVLPLALTLSATLLPAQAQQSSPIDDLLRRAGDAFNDLNYGRADSLARQVLAVGPRITAAQRTRALLVIAAASYPEEPTAQRRAVALTTLKQIVRSNLNLKLPQELTWAGLDSLVDEAKRTTFALEVSGDTQQVLVGPQGLAHITVRSSRPGTFQLTVLPAAGGSAAAVVDSMGTTNAGEFTFTAMRNERPIFSSAEYAVIVTGVDAATHDTVTVRYGARVEAPPIEFMTTPTKLDSSKLLPERTGKFGAKAIIPGVLAGAFAVGLSGLKGDIKGTVAGDSKGMAVGGVLAVSTILAGFLDRGRQIPANVAANHAYASSFQKSIEDTQAENRKRIAEYKTILHLDLEVR